MTMTEPDTPTSGPYAAAAATYWTAGWKGVLPLPARQKLPVPTGWTGRDGAWPSYPDIHAWTEERGHGNIALRLPPSVLGVDVDHYDSKPGGMVLAELEARHGALPPTWRTTSRDDGISGIRLYRVPEGLRWPGVLGPGIETIRTEHRYAVVWPSIHPNGGTYRWITPDGATALGVVPTIDELPHLPQAWVDHFTRGELSTDQPRADLTGAQVTTWVATRDNGARPPCGHMRTATDRACADLLTGASRHDAALAGTNRIVWLVGEGHVGGPDALTRLRAEFLRATAGDRATGDAEAEWARMVDGAVLIAAAAHPNPNPDPCDDPFHGLISKENQWTKASSSAPTSAPAHNTCPTAATTTVAASTAAITPTTSPSHGSPDSPSTPASAATSGPADGATSAQASTLPSEVAPTADDLTLLNPDQQHVFYLQELAKLHARHAAQRHFDRTREDDVVADRVRRKLLDDKAAAEYKRVTEPPAPPFDLDTLAGILARPDEPPMRIQGLMPWSGSALVVAQRKTGKTTLLLNYARCLLTGEDFLGAHPIIPLEPGERVAFLNYEVSGKQLARWAHECGSDPDRLVLANLRGRRNPLGHIDDRTQLAKALRDLNVRSVIVDPFGRAYTGVSQNDNGEVQAFLVGLEEFVRSDVGALDLMLATHAGWDGERTRGASALEDWGDTIITLTKDDDGNRFLRAVGRDVDVDEDQLVMDPLSRFLTMTGNGGRKPLSSAKSQAKVAQLAVGAVRAVTEAPGCSRADIKRALGDMDDMPRIARGGRGEELLTTVLKHAERSGAVRCETKGNGHPSAYFPVELSTTTPTTPGALPGVVHHHHPSPYIRGGVGGGGRGLTVREVQGSAYYFDPITRQQVNPETGEVIA